MSDLKLIIKLAAQVVLLRHGDVTTEDGSYATTDCDSIIYLEELLARYFNLDSDDITFENMSDLTRKIDEMPNIEQQQARIEKLEQRNTELAETVERLLKACELARDNYGKMLMTDPPQEAWKANQVTARLVEAIAASPKQNLNVVKREVAREAFIAGYELAESAMEGQFFRAHNVDGFANKYANTKYPSGKD